MFPPLALFAIVALGNIGLGLLVYVHNPRSLTNRLFFVFAIAVALWTIGIGSTLYFAGTPPSLLSARFTFLGAAASVYALLAFLHSFPSPSLFRLSPSLIVLGFMTLLLSTLAFTPWLVKAISLTSSGLYASYGPLYYPFALFILSCVTSSFSLILKRLRSTTGRERLQTKYLFFGLVVPGISATATNLLVPLLLGRSNVSHVGPLFSLVMVVLVAHTIIRHRLMNIHLFIGRSVAYGLTLLASGILFVALFGLLHPLVFTPRLQLWVNTLVALLIALLFQPLSHWLKKSTDKYLYRHSYDYQRTLHEATATMATLLDLSSLLNYLADVITDITRCESIRLYTLNSQGGFDNPIARSTDSLLEPLPLDATSPVLPLLSPSRGPVLRDDLLASHASSDALHFLSASNASLLLPIFSDRGLAALLVLGSKRSGDPYFAEDIQLLSTLAGQASVALKNAQLYREVVHINRYIENILATMESGVIAVDPLGHITLFNRAAAKMLAASPIDDRRSLDALPWALQRELHATLIDGLSRLHIESVLLDQDGRDIPIAASTTPFRDQDSAIIGAVIVFNDLSHLKELESANHRAQRLASVAALASGVAHEIKNPLVAIRTFAELLPDRFSDSDFRDSFSQVAIREIERIDLLVARLRDLALPATRPFRPLNILEPLEETLALLRGQLEQKHIQLRRRFSVEQVPISGDFAQLKQLFLNILMNSIDAMGPAGVLTVRTVPRQMQPSPQIVILISDTGTGLPPDVAGRLFDPFVTTKKEGSGLGLAICRGIADAHNATINIKNNDTGGGTTVSLSFPLLLDAPLTLSH